MQTYLASTSSFKRHCCSFISPLHYSPSLPQTHCWCTREISLLISCHILSAWLAQRRRDAHSWTAEGRLKRKMLYVESMEVRQSFPNDTSISVFHIVYIYIYAVKSIIGPSLAIFKVNNWAKSKSIVGPRSFSHYKNRGFKRFVFAQLSLCVCFFVPNY